MNDYGNSRGNEDMMGFVLGMVVGAAAALLLAPASGEETRRRLADTTRRWRDKGQEFAGKVRSRFQEETGQNEPTGAGQGSMSEGI